MLGSHKCLRKKPNGAKGGENPKFVNNNPNKGTALL